MPMNESARGFPICNRKTPNDASIPAHQSSKRSNLRSKDGGLDENHVLVAVSLPVVVVAAVSHQSLKTTGLQNIFSRDGASWPSLRATGERRRCRDALAEFTIERAQKTVGAQRCLA
jgi:hypothetical protein